MHRVEFLKNQISERSEKIKSRLKGQNTKLRPSKPNTKKDDGLIKCIWRMARFHSGDDPCLPITCWWALGAWFKENGYEEKIEFKDDREEIMNTIDTFVDQILDEWGLDKYGGARKWSKVLM